MKKNNTIIVERNAEVPFHNNVDYCIGTGRMGLALTKEYHDELAFVQREIGFKHIRGHGLLCDDMAIYHRWEEEGELKTEYNFTYLDRVMDDYRELGLKPFIELGFMPEKLASGTQTIFYWKGNTTPPSDYEEWVKLVKAVLGHLILRYGREEVVNWPVEVWNEPNLPGFWEHADMEEYFRLFRLTFAAVKEVDSRFKVGGPAVCGGTDEKWISAFMDFCERNDIAVDMVTRHHYTIERPQVEGHYAYSRLMDPEDGFANLQTTRTIIDSHERYKGLPIHITEFNSSYTPLGVIHDTNLNAAFQAKQLSRLGDVNESYSYWTFGDVFEEQGVPYTPFHGGFGLVAHGCIAKPVFWTFAFFKKLQEGGGRCIYRDDNMVIMKAEDGSFRGVLWNPETELADDKDAVRNVCIKLPAEDGEYSFIEKLVDEKTCNPLKVWHDMGEPAGLTAEQTKLLKDSAVPLIRSERTESRNKELILEFSLGRNAVLYFCAEKRPVHSDRGYDYSRVVRGDAIIPYRYRNVFAEIGKSAEEIEAKAENIIETFFRKEGEQIYFPVGEDMGYLTDTGNDDVRTEGMSYGMMMCVQLGMKEEFDRIWKWTKTYMWMAEGENEGYFAWSCGLDGNKNSMGPAPDGEEYFAMALFFASHRWGDGEGIFNYSKEAREILRACLHKGENGRAGAPMWNHDNHQILFIPGCEFTDPSYHLPHFYELFAMWAYEEDRPFWKEAAGTSREYLKKSCNPITGMSPEYAEFSGEPCRRFAGEQRRDLFYSDAYRTAANIGLDYAWFGIDCGQADAAFRLMSWLSSAECRDPGMTFELYGKPTERPARHPLGMLAATTQGALAVNEDLSSDALSVRGMTAKAWVSRFWDMPMRTGKNRYYDNCLYVFAFLALSGKYRIW